jgi:regulation of enolase protein 1 (concanavalin A-like superfamily)
MTEPELRVVEVCLRRVAFALAVLLSFETAAHAQVPSPWTNDDVGQVSIAGSASLSSGTFTVRASGADIWNSPDSFHFVYQVLAGDGQITARVGSITQAHLLSQAGLMMRDGLGPSDPLASIFLTAGGKRRFVRRLVPGGLKANVSEGTAATPYWIRLVRTGDVFRAYFSGNGSTWTAGGSTTIPMSHTIYVGLAAMSQNQSALTTATFSNVSVQATGSSTNQLPTVSITSPASGSTVTEPASITIQASANDADGGVNRVEFFEGSRLVGTDTTSPYSVTVANVAEGTYSLTAAAVDNDGGRRTSAAVSLTVNPGNWPWLDEDVGSISVAGSTTYGFGRMTIRAAGADIWGTADAFRFTYRALAGDGQIVARVDSLQATDIWAKAGVMMRETLSAGSAHASAFQSSGAGVAFQRRAVPGGQSTHTAGTTGAVPRWLRLVRQGATFTASESADGVTWRTIGSQSISMQPTIYVGIAVTSHRSSTLTTASVSRISVQGGAAPSNQPPTVSLTSPAAGATFTAPASINLAATAADSDGSVTRVQFFRGTTLVATDTTSPFTYSWTNVAAGTYSLKAVAQDDDGATRTSTAVSITVNSPTTTPPTRAVFTPSVDHASVQSYLLEIFRATDNPATATPVATRNIGKPAVVNNEISVDIATLIQALAPGSYKATMSSVNGTARSRSAPSPTFVR